MIDTLAKAAVLHKHNPFFNALATDLYGGLVFINCSMSSMLSIIKTERLFPDVNLICSKQVEEDVSHLAKFIDINKKHITHMQSHSNRYRVTKIDLLIAMHAIQDSLFTKEKSIKDATESQWLKAFSEMIEHYGETQKDTSRTDLEFLQRTLGKKK